MTTHHLILVRHAQAAPAPLGGNDRLRSLTSEGADEAERLGEKLAERLAGLDIGKTGVQLWHSTATRTTQTASAIAACMPQTLGVHGLDALYDLDPYGILELLRETPEAVRTLILIGHNPALAETCRHLASDAIDGPIARELMKGYEPGTATVFTVSSDWAGLSPNTATLDAVLRP